MIETDFLVWLFKTIIYLAATGSVLILLLLTLKKIFHRVLSPKWHYYIWLLLLIRLIIPFEPESSFSIYNVFYSTAERINLPIAETFTGLQTGLPETVPGETIGNIPPIQPQDNPDGNPSGNLIPDETIAGSGVNRSESGTMIKIAAIFWLGGIIILTLYISFINITFALNVRRHYVPLREVRIEDILASCKEMLGIRHRIPVLTSKKVRTPALYGLFHPCILVSESYMKQLNEEEIKYIFLHELSHYKRKDIAINWLLTCLRIIYFFNPLLWYAFYKIHEDCEISCDAEALKYLKEEEYQQYGNTIIKLIRLFSESNFIPTTAGISKNKSSYRRRIIMISRFKPSKWIGTFLSVIIIAVVAVVGLTGCKTTTETQQENTMPSTPPDNTTSPTPVEPSPTDSDNTSDLEPTTTPNPEDSDQKNYYGQWLVTEVLAYGAVGTYSSEDAEKLIGQSLSLSDQEANIINDQPSEWTSKIENPEYQENTITSEDFLLNYQMSFDNLGITTDSVTEVVIAGSDEAAGCTLLMKDNHTIIIIAGGTYFQLMKP